MKLQSSHPTVVLHINQSIYDLSCLCDDDDDDDDNNEDDDDDDDDDDNDDDDIDWYQT